MKPTFALDLTRETIGLLHRTPKGWLSIGEVAFDAPDLPEAMDYLRKTALGLSPLGVATKLILPNSQILYTEVHAPGPSRDEKRRQIAAALEGRTPYDVAELVFDWSGKGATVKVAVIARETLDQAEAFAAEHRLNPVSFVAIPEDGTFVGEPWFGPTTAAASILAEDETVDRDREPVSILQRELPKAEPVAPKPPEPQPPAAAAVEDDLPGLAEALNADVPDVLPAADALLDTTLASLPPVDDPVDDDAEDEPKSDLRSDDSDP
ncbi:MAG TPA: translation initiation factor 2, partial [Tabrizicola sp.]